MSELLKDTGPDDLPSGQQPAGNHAWWGVALCVLAIAGLGYYAHASEVQFEQRIAAAQEQSSELTQELQALKKDNASVSSNLQHAVDRLGETAKELASTREATDNLRQAETKTAHDTKANAQAVQSVRADADGKVATVDGRVTTVSNNVKTVADNLASTRQDIEGQINTSTAKLSDRIAKNGTELASLREQNAREMIPFDIRKNSPPETWTVAGIRIELKKADVGKAKYNVVLHVDDRLLEKKDRTVDEPVPIIVGPDHQQYEVVVTAVEHDRIRGYVSVPKAVAMSAGTLQASN